jgi:hypothetical protein
MTQEQALRIARLMIDNGVSREMAIDNPAIPADLREFVREALEREETIILEPARMLVAEPRRDEWLRQIDRSQWYYWPTLRDYLLVTKNWPAPSVRSLDEITNRILGQLNPPETEQFDIRGLVLGFVQSGKTANFTALIAKAADVGYRLIVVLSGIDNGLRRQTQIRLDRELVGYADNRSGAVNLPPMGRQWHQFTNEELNGDFRPGLANYAALQGSQPVLLVVKKNGAVLRRLHTWIDAAPDDVRRVLPVLIIDDEADQASVDTRGTYQAEENADDAEYEPPSIINGLIRDLLRKFQRHVYVAYTATPFANILIPHDTIDRTVGNDLYPKDFVVDLPRPEGYFGAEELFGRLDRVSGEEVEGLDVIRSVTDQDVLALEQNTLPPSLEIAILDFILGGAARAHRGQADLPATMLIHTSSRIAEQQQLASLVNQSFAESRDEWRYDRRRIRERLRAHWNAAFRSVTRARHAELDVEFDQMEEYIGPFFESVDVRVVNSFSGEVLDYEREPSLKTIAVGGNRLSRGLTLEGLMVSYFVRRSVMYDTLMQMGRWFGFRNGYDDLTRIYMTDELAGWFSDLALVEHELREDIQAYESQNLTPLQLGTRILQHPAMLVTSRLKQRFASTITVEQSYSAQVVQTVRFPFRRPDSLRDLLDDNLEATRSFLERLGVPASWSRSGPLWQAITADTVLEFLGNYQVDPEARSVSLPLLRAYIERQLDLGELTNWTVAVKGRESLDRTLGDLDLEVPGGRIHQISRTRLASDPDSLGVITSPGDEEEGLSTESLDLARRLQEGEKLGANPAARRVRPATEGLLLLYPISRYSGYDLQEGGSRRGLFENPDDVQARDVLGLAISFPHSDNAQQVTGQYTVGTVGWRPV